ncbi:hypothetical protein QYM36_010547 [Artemia franciscana]|uniref:SET domain-containing protein n=1 Tax=Artemia franciscana TaxID=6661 RepID=A0AA88HVN9_ARTSF|nr:hypothetical protein QYM36_010547 [Artemia franciscana]
MVDRIDPLDITNIKALSTWMKTQNWRNIAKLEPCRFKDSGRGMRTRKGLEAGQLLVQIPRLLLMTAGGFRSSKEWSWLVDKNLSCHDALVLYLLVEKNKRDSSFFHAYIKTLPEEFSMPTDLGNEMICMLPTFIAMKFQDKIKSLQDSFKKVARGYKNICIKELGFCEFKWAYYVVNTRAVHITGSSGKFNADSSDCMALVPFLDLLNHTHDTSCISGFNPDTNCYEIETLSKTPKCSEVFINYGPHDNLSLFVEYGFLIPRNPNNCLPLEMTDFISACNEYDVKLSNLCLQTISLHNLMKNLGLFTDGPSWSVKALLKVLSCDWSSLMRIEDIIYRDFENQGLTEKTLLNCILDKKKGEVCDSLSAIAKDKSCLVTNCIVSFLEECLSIIEFSYAN